jgi:hypothetical protein
MKISYEVLFKEGTIIIESIDESFDSISIEIDQFWSWVKREGLNEYCEDYYDKVAVTFH